LPRIQTIAMVIISLETLNYFFMNRK